MNRNTKAYKKANPSVGQARKSRVAKVGNPTRKGLALVYAAPPKN